MALHELAGKPAPRSFLVNVPRLVSAYYAVKPDPSDPGQRVAFGTSGHRGSSLRGSFNEDHILATTEALVVHRRARGITGPLFLGMDTHALSEPALATALEVLRRPRGRGADPGGTALHAHPGDLARDPGLEPRAEGRPGGRRRGDPLPQPAGRRGLQVQPARRRTGGRRHHEGRGGAGQCDPGEGAARGEARHPREGAPRRDHPGARLRPARARRQARAPLLPRQRPAPRLRLLRGEARPFGPGSARGLRHVRPPGLVAPGQLQRGPHPRDHRGPRRAPPRRAASRARSSSAWTPTRSPSPPSRRHSRCWPPTGSRCGSRRDGATRPPRRSRTRSWPGTAGGRPTLRTASW